MEKETQTQEEKVHCYGCGKELKDNDSCFVDAFFVEWFGQVFCSEECRNDYIESK